MSVDNHSEIARALAARIKREIAIIANQVEVLSLPTLQSSLPFSSR